MRAKWAGGKLYLELHERDEAKPLLEFLQRIGTMVPGTVQSNLRNALSDWYGQRYLEGERAVVTQPVPRAPKLPAPVKSENWDDERPEDN